MSVIPERFVSQNGHDAIAVALGRAIDTEEAGHQRRLDQLDDDEKDAINDFVSSARSLAIQLKAAEGDSQHDVLKQVLQTTFQQGMSIPLRRSLGVVISELDVYLFSPQGSL